MIGQNVDVECANTETGGAEAATAIDAKKIYIKCRADTNTDKTMGMLAFEMFNWINKDRFSNLEKSARDSRIDETTYVNKMQLAERNSALSFLNLWKSCQWPDSALPFTVPDAVKQDPFALPGGDAYLQLMNNSERGKSHGEFLKRQHQRFTTEGAVESLQ